MVNEKQNLKVLVGDDQIGVVGSACNERFVDDYGHIASYDFSSESDDFISRAREGGYDALIVDLRWGTGLETEGYRVLAETRDCAAVRILHTSESDEARGKGYEHGATHCIAKGCMPRDLEMALRGLENQSRCKGVERRC